MAIVVRTVVKGFGINVDDVVARHGYDSVLLAHGHGWRFIHHGDIDRTAVFIVATVVCDIDHAVYAGFKSDVATVVISKDSTRIMYVYVNGILAAVVNGNGRHPDHGLAGITTGGGDRKVIGAMQYRRFGIEYFDGLRVGANVGCTTPPLDDFPQTQDFLFAGQIHDDLVLVSRAEIAEIKEGRPERVPQEMRSARDIRMRMTVAVEFIHAVAFQVAIVGLDIVFRIPNRIDRDPFEPEHGRADLALVTVVVGSLPDAREFFYEVGIAVNRLRIFRQQCNGRIRIAVVVEIRSRIGDAVVAIDGIHMAFDLRTELIFDEEFGPAGIAAVGIIDHTDELLAHIVTRNEGTSRDLLHVVIEDIHAVARIGTIPWTAGQQHDRRDLDLAVVAQGNVEFSMAGQLTLGRQLMKNGKGQE